ncbi:hypothetical protein GUJ93_ZPchr0012g21518 [Zizania palustris]|uniref:Uncharacterized protein n=1 Tax=Zizania palustris TaxID=103762 RepID=A0A8J5WQL7_ZIZPA|nr:hypothetical protein GUJ93_ZPchr0012g21518 [Zizania palustris]
MLMATYYFTKWTEAMPLKNMTHNEANGQAESSNKTVIKLIKKKIEEFPKRSEGPQSYGLRKLPASLQPSARRPSEAYRTEASARGAGFGGPGRRPTLDRDRIESDSG